MTLSEIRRRVDALKRKFARELAIIKLRRIAEAVADDWTPAEPPEPSAVIRRIVKAGFRLPTFVRFAAASRTPDEKVKSPTPNPSCSACCPGPTTTATETSSAGTSPHPPRNDDHPPERVRMRHLT